MKKILFLILLIPNIVFAEECLFIGGNYVCLPAMTAADLSCTDCIGATEITDIYMLNSGDTITGSLNFSSIASDITTTSNEHLNIVPDGTGNVGINSINPRQKLDVNGSVIATSFIGNASTATALAANGTNCSSGNYPLGVDASGNVEDCTAVGGPGGSIILDLADDASNESTALAEIAITGDTNSIFTEPASDKLLITVANDWPKADTSDDLTCTNCIGATEIDGANLESEIEVVVDLQDLQGAVIDAQVPDNITITENDPQVGTLTNTKWCTTDGSAINCTSDAPGGSGDNVSVDSGAVVDPDFVSTGDIDFVNTANSITANINQDVIVAADFADADWGDITIATNVASVEDDSHAHTSTTISGLDISADTNLTAGDALTLTDDDIDFDGGASPGGELGGTWASPTIDDNISVSSWNITTPIFSGIVNFDGSAVSDDDCTGQQGSAWYDDTDASFEFCNANTGVPSIIATTSGDITDVFSCASGDCASITVADGDLLNFSGANNSAATEGIILPQGTAPTGGTAEGQIGWDTDNDFLRVGDGTGTKAFVDVTQLYPSDVTSTECTANITADAASALSVTGCSYYSFTSDNATSTNRTFCLLAGTEGQKITLFADVSGTNEIELGDGAAGACAGATGAATFLAGVWPAATNQNNDVATIVYRTTSSGAVANGWYEVSRAAN